MAEAAFGISPAISAGGYHSCGLRNDGSALCWGYNEYGQASVPPDVGPLSQLSAGAFHTCALTTDGAVVCWGNNTFGQASPPAGLGSVQQLSAANYHTCALKLDGTVTCWGSTGGLQILVPAGLNSVTQISAGIYHSCARRADATIVCWGYNDFGESTVPDDLNDVAQVSVGYALTCALRETGTVRCLGDDEFGEASVPAGLGSVSQISAGEFHVCALRTDSTVVCWGDNSLGQSSVPSGLAAVVRVSAGTYHTCAQKSDGTVVCWGASSWGQTNPGDLDLTIEPQTISFTSSAPAPGVVGTTYSLSAHGGPSGNPVVFSSLTEAVCTVDGNIASLVAAGMCTVAADQAGRTGYTAAPRETQSFAVDTRPVANAGAAQTGNEGSPVTFNASASSDADGDALVSYNWSFGDGTAASTTSATVQHTYADNSSASPYVVRLTVIDRAGVASLPATTAATIGNVTPTAVFAPASPAGEGTMALSLTNVRDASGDVPTLQYGFDCGDGAGYRAFVSSASFACIASDNGARTVRARVRDKDGAVSEYGASVSVVNVAPSIVILSAPATGSISADYTIQYRFSDPGSSDAPWWYQATWGDGKKGSAATAVITQGTTISQKYRYATPGAYTITIRVTDKDGGTTTASVPVTITR